MYLGRTGGVESPQPTPPTTGTTLARYDDLGLLGKGGMGEVRRIRDRELNRKLAMKIIHKGILDKPAAVARFVEEGQVCAQLQHPNIVPVHEMGKLPDGRLYFTMLEIQGREFTEAIEAVHAAIQHERWHPTPDGWNFRRLVDVFHQVCNAVAYAHAKGVVHRDLKPENVMIGSYGEVLVVDWGIAKVKGRPDHAAEEDDLEVVSTKRFEEGAHKTRVGQVAGTPAYMAPEQARGQIGQIDARTDVYALGAILYEILSGRAPFIGTSGMHVLQQVLSGPPVSLHTSTAGATQTMGFNFFDEGDIQAPSGPPLPEELLVACERAMSRDPNDRHQSANELAEEIEAWLEGAKKREQALKVVEEALQADVEAAALKEKAAGMRAEAEARLKEIPTWEAEEVKAPHWAVEDEAAELEQQAQLLRITREEKLQGALTHKADLPEAHAELAAQYRVEHEAAEAARDEAEIQQAEVRLVEHANALPIAHPDRESHFAYLKGDGALSLVISEPGAEVLLENYKVHNRRLVARPVKSLGVAPLVSIPLEMGSYRLRIRKEGFHEVLYPVSIGRGEHWDGVHPGTKESVPVWLPPLGSLGEDDCYVPAGWFWSGGDPNTAHSLPRQRVWMASLVMKRFPVTNREYIAFLNDLVRQGREEEALKHVPRERAGQSDQLGAMIYGRDEQGGFVLMPDADGDLWGLDWPVMMVDLHGSTAYAEWKAEQASLPWRLPEEFEWEKSARGADGRFFPWGDGFDAARCCIRDSHKGQMLPAVMDSFPMDVSPYGVRGMAGNMRDWTATVYRKEGPPLLDGLEQQVDSASEEKTFSRVYRGGCWNFVSRFSRVSFRGYIQPDGRNPSLGFRLARSVSD
jgi:eukaryotic-like serine/threonine-protein kinase